MRVMFTIPGPPKGKARPQIVRNHGKVHSYTPDATAAYEELVRIKYLQAEGSVIKLQGPIEILIFAGFPIPKSASKRKREQMLRREILPAKMCIRDRVCDNAWVHGNALVCGNALVHGNALVRGGAWDKSPLYIQGSKWSVCMTNLTHIQIGCQNHSISDWIDHGVAIARRNHADDIIPEYIWYIVTAAMRYGTADERERAQKLLAEVYK